MFRKLSYTWELMGASWGVLKQDKELLLFPLLAGVCCLLVMATFAFPVWYTRSWQPPRGEASWSQKLSASLLKKTWGEQLVGNFSFGFVFFLPAIPACLAIALAVHACRELKSMPLAAVASAAVGVLYLILLALIQSALQSIFQAALYLHAGSKLDKSHYPDLLLSDALDYRRR
jgi:hypothetical protein